ncbi:hypothetical protein CVD25_18870 [Bacillus canaveralius]|uniref:Sirohydrochlorin chelatase n=1 Tax=Bacillus canaveralius TaxID=1403243 RepID=A0A2N5GG50_9BACI|nr:MULTISPECIES: sirohydrochlorin chelatase [Bacillus]PLR79680.1 hypothetical protein CU635_21745 [Bacillus canaveralius]PLR87103.1 hypothetical protein CVD23_04595 [Bacillus sp. V33-4]PLR91980.1 hypothetical protein CVD25_18870 [Bacillus canaveralius]
MEAVIFAGHGSRTGAGNQEFIDFIEMAMESLNTPIKAYSFYERAEPSILQAVENVIRQGATEVTVIPVLLLPGIHANSGIPQEIARARAIYPEIVFKCGEAIGVDPIIIDILKDRLASKMYAHDGNEAVLLVSHGSPDPVAAVEMEAISCFLGEELGTKSLVGYLINPPYFLEKLAELHEQSFQKVYIIPYLLFGGRFQSEVEERIAAFEQSNSSMEFIFCDPIGFDERIKKLLIQRAEGAKQLQ